MDKNIQATNKHINDLVSVIMPAYNCDKFIASALDSVSIQTYQNWELIVVDDCSTDNTANVIKNYVDNEARVKYYRLDHNSGAAIARNTAVNIANGRYLAFLDSDDVWEPEKLKKQIGYMKQHDYHFTCTSYRKIDEDGNFLNQVIEAKARSDYFGVLKTCPGNSTVVYDAEALGKFTIPDIKKRNDYVMWLQIIKKAKFLYGISEPLGSHRLRKGSISGNKFSLIQYHWKVYREIEHLSYIKSALLVGYWCVVSALKLR